MKTRNPARAVSNRAVRCSLRGKKKMKILITAPENDNHTAPLKWALERAGYSVACWAGLGWTDDRQASISLLPDLQIKNPHLKLAIFWVEPGAVFWIQKPVQPKPNPQ